MKGFTLITGASSGIGLELAKIAARDGNNLVLVARNKAGLEKTKHEILMQPENDKVAVEIIALDLSKNSSAQTLYDFCQKKKIVIETLVNNAGYGDYGDFARSNLARQLSMIDLNIRSLTELTHLFLQDMVTKKRGRIMNVGSVASFLPGPLMSVYFASKNYVLRFSEALSEELRGSGVTVTCLCPGSTKTNFGKSAHVSESHSTANPKTTPRDVAEYGWYHLQLGTRVAVYGFENRVSIKLAKLVPSKLLTKLVKKVQK